MVYSCAAPTVQLYANHSALTATGSARSMAEAIVALAWRTAKKGAVLE